MDNNNMHVTKVMPDVQMQAITQTEGICPVCGSKHTVYSNYERCAGKLWQNHYDCLDCHSEWVGNTYDEAFNKISAKDEEERFAPKKNSFFEALAYLVEM